MKYGRVELSDARTADEGTVSLYVPAFSIHAFSMVPEIAAGILYGRIDSGDTSSLKAYLQIGVAANYRISNMSCGITYKNVHYGAGTVPLLGWNYSLAF